MTDRPTRKSPSRKRISSAKSVRTSLRRDRSKDGVKRARQSGAITPRSGGYAVVVATMRRRGGISTNRTLRGDAVVIHAHGVTIAGTARAVEDFLDGQEIDRRLADLESSRRIPWSELKATRGL